MSIHKVPATQTTQGTPAPLQTIDVYLIQFNQLSGIGPILAFVFNPTVLTLPNTGGTEVTSYQVTFNLTSNIPNATVTAEDTQSGAPPSGITTTGSGTKQLTVTFSNEGIPPGAPLPLHYKLTVNANGHTYTSDDPEIDIPPPT